MARGQKRQHGRAQPSNMEVHYFSLYFA